MSSQTPSDQPTTSEQPAQSQPETPGPQDPRDGLEFSQKLNPVKITIEQKDKSGKTVTHTLQTSGYLVLAQTIYHEKGNDTPDKAIMSVEPFSNMSRPHTMDLMKRFELEMYLGKN